MILIMKTATEQWNKTISFSGLKDVKIKLINITDTDMPVVCQTKYILHDDPNNFSERND